MRLFVFGTGRCGSVAVSRSFLYASNFTVGHETYNPYLDYPDQHVEVNPQFRIVADKLVAQYPDAMYCFLERDIRKTARSYAKLNDGAWLDYWWELCPQVRPSRQDDAAMVAVSDLVRQCEWAWSQCPENQRVMIDIDCVDPAFRDLWFRIGAEGDLATAMASFDYPINTSDQRENG